MSRAAVRYAAFLRAINVGGRVVKMDALKKIFASLKLANVETYIASGNVVFESAATEVAALERTIEAALEKKLGFDVPTFLRSAAELRGVVDEAPFAQKDGDPPLLVGFMRSTPTPAQKKALLALQTPTDAFVIVRREFWWKSKLRQADNKLSNTFIEKACGFQSTIRNVNTVQAMAARWGS